jgi:Ca2+-transporting ATPase
VARFVLKLWGMQAPPPQLLPPAEGLGEEEAAARLVRSGRNELHREDPTSAWRILGRQFASPVVALLIVACVAAAALGEGVDAAAIGVIVVLNAVVGFFQEHRAEQAVRALRAMTAPRARVRRAGRVRELPAAEVVPGDLLVLDAGDLVAADARLVEAHSLETVEAALTGESAPVSKSTQPVPQDAPLAERSDRVFAGTAVSRGSGLAEVIATGMETELGRIAAMLATATDEQTPLQVRLARVSRTLLFICLALVAVVAVVGLLQGRPWLEVLMGAVSLAVAAVPEGLPAVVTIALAVGVQRMAARNVLVRRLHAVEALGSTSVICTDKTGTLTTGRMAVREVWAAPGMASADVVRAGAACCDADLDGGAGDPTELAILAAARALGVEKPELEQRNPRRETRPFDADTMRMSVLRADGRLYLKGAPDRVRALLADPAGLEEANGALAARGLRVLAVAVGDGPSEAGLRLCGLLGIADPPRAEAVAAVAEARRAGIATVMITGDHPATARAIAREMGIVGDGEDPAERVHARVSPEDKLRIVRSWKNRGAVVAMTGDGVNDAPALREAHVGVAMGRTGTEVTREAADLVLADDNFASIVAGVREGRAIFDNIRKTLVYLLTGNAGELSLVLGGALLGLPPPLLPLHLLWINLVTDGLPALALVLDPPGADALAHPPRPLDEPMLGRPQWRVILAVGVLEAAVALGVYVLTIPSDGEAYARTLAFTTLVFAELLRSFAARHVDRVLHEIGVGTNPYLLGVVLVSFALQGLLLSFPPARALFGLATLAWSDLLLCFALGLIPVSVLELKKLLFRR